MSLNSIVLQYNTEELISAMIKEQFISPDTIQTLELLGKELLKYNNINSSRALSFDVFSEMLEQEHNNIMTYRGVKLLEKALLQKNEPSANPDEIFKSLMMQAQNEMHRGDGYACQLLAFADRLYSYFDDDFLSALGFKYSTYSKLLLFAYKFYIECIKNNIETLWINKNILYRRFDRSEIDNIIKYMGIKLGVGDVEFITGLNPLYSKPIIDFEDRIYIPLLSSTLMNLPKVFHYNFVALKTFGKDVVAKYTKHRGDVVEELTIEFLSTIVPPNEIHRSLFYPHKGDNEADVTISKQDCCLLFECKSKILTLPSLQGKIENIDSDVHDAIGKAYEQAVRTLKWIEQGGSFEKETTEGISQLTLTKPKKYFVLCITAENFGCVPYEIEKYVTIDPSIQIVPVVINIYDLEIILKESNSYSDFISYLEYRDENYHQLLAVDELDVFGDYKTLHKSFFVDSGSFKMPCYQADMFNQKYDRPLI